MNILNQPISAGSCKSSSLSKEASSKITNNPLPASVKIDGTTQPTKQNLSSLKCKASNVLHERLSKAAQFQPYMLNFLPSIFQEKKFTQATSAESLVLTVAVSSAVKLNQDQIDLIAKKMRRITGFTNLNLVTTVDPSLIAGFVISYGMDESCVIDLSVKAQLAKLANKVEASDQRAHNRV
ncbi:ATP synthase subunit delta [Rhynchospora pubera]|uniref:ATP synthase subunit delta n=1 Tax=Rhynchospora pubera TaxID=906938 RepID=A0AAV8CLV5_9POAL|nr:ATP synthase subunit delta [Rhynchospora pubera]